MEVDKSNSSASLKDVTLISDNTSGISLVSAEVEIKKDPEKDQPKQGCNSKEKSKCHSTAEEIKEMIYLAAQGCSQMTENLELAETNLQRYTSENHNLQVQVGECSAKHREEMQNLEDKMVSVKQECDNQLANQDNEQERRAGQLRSLMKECYISKRELGSQTMEVLSIKKEIATLVKEKQKLVDSRKKREAKYSTLAMDIEQIQKDNSNISAMVEDVKNTAEMVSKVGHEFRAAISQKAKDIEFWEAENQKLKDQNTAHFIEIQRNKNAAKYDSCDQMPAEQNKRNECTDAERLLYESELKIKRDVFDKMLKKKASLEYQLQKANDAIQIYQNIEPKWENTEKALLKTEESLE